MKGLGAALLFSMLVVPATAARPSEEETPFQPTGDLIQLLSARGEGGEALIGSEQREYFEELPVRAKQLFEGAIEDELISEASQLGEILSLGLSAAKLELLIRDNCALCHTNPSEQDAETLFSTDPDSAGSPPHLNLKEFVSDVHFRRGLSCSGCHGGAPDDDDMADEIYERWPEAPDRHEDRSWIPEFCGGCHSDPGAMRRFDPSLPTDQYAKYRESMHGKKLLEQGDSKAAQCVSCHGVHGIRGSNSPRSSVHPKMIPYTCGRCHADSEYMKLYVGSNGERLPTNQLEEFERSVHGRALLDRSDLGAPACNDCHGNHAAMPPEVSSVAQVCRTCHAGNGELFDGSKHKEAFELHEWPECEVCHGNHEIARTDDSMLSEQSDSLCYECHREHAQDNPECTRVAKYFYTTITAVASESESLAELVHELAEKGLDVDPLSETVEELEDILRQSRSGIHAFDRGEFEKVERRGREALEEGWQLVASAEEEYRFRRNGLLISVAIMVFLTVVIYLKIREIESRG
jgi:predicted CXXCH cytochrome family protein